MQLCNDVFFKLKQNNSFLVKEILTYRKKNIFFEKLRKKITSTKKDFQVMKYYLRLTYSFAKYSKFKRYMPIPRTIQKFAFQTIVCFLIISWIIKLV